MEKGTFFTLTSRAFSHSTVGICRSEVGAAGLSGWDQDPHRDSQKWILCGTSKEECRPYRWDPPRGFQKYLGETWGGRARSWLRNSVQWAGKFYLITQCWLLCTHMLEMMPLSWLLKSLQCVWRKSWWGRSFQDMASHPRSRLGGERRGSESGLVLNKPGG